MPLKTTHPPASVGSRAEPADGNDLRRRADLIRQILSTLTPREEKILRLRFGIGDDDASMLKFDAIIGGSDSGVSALDRFHLSPIEAREAIEQVNALTPDLIQYLKRYERDLEKIPWDVFEHLIAEFMAGWGLDDVRLVGRDSTTQADVAAIHRVEPAGISLKYFVEVKRRRDRVGVEVINQVYGAFALEQPRHGWTLAMLVSLGGYTDTDRFTESELVARNLHLKTKSHVIKWLRQYRPGPKGLWLPKPTRCLRTDV